MLLAHGLALTLLLGTLALQWRAAGVDDTEAGRARVGLLLYDNDLERVWTPEAPEILRYHDFLERWGSDELVLAVADGPAPLRAEDLDHLRAWAEAIAEAPGFEVDVIWAGQLPYAPEGLVFGEPVDPASLPAFLEALAGDDGASAFFRVGEVRWAASLLLRFEREGLSDADRAALSGWLQQTWDALEPPPGDARAAMGTAVLLGEVRAAILRSLETTVPLANLVVILCCLLVFRRLRVVPLVLAGVIQGELLAVGLFLVAGRAFNYVSAFMATSIIVVGFATNIHLFTRYGAERARHGAHEALSRAAAEVARPSAISLATTCFALLALTTAEQIAIVDFGLFTALGTVVVLACAYTLGPALLALFDHDGAGARGPTGLRLPSPAPLGLWAWNHPRAVVLSSLSLALLATLGLRELELGSNVRESFVADSAVSRDIQFIAERTPGVMAHELELSWPGTEAEGARALDQVAEAERLLVNGLVVRGEPTTSAQVLSAADPARSFCRAPGREALCPGGWPQPETAAALVQEGLAEQRLALIQHDGERWWAHITVLTGFLYAHEAVALAGEVEQLLGEAGYAATVTGLASLWSELEADIVDDLLASFALGGGVVALLLLLSLRDRRLFAVALPANALPLLVVGGGAGWLFSMTGTHVNSTAAMFLTVTVGLVVDDTLFFLLGFQRRMSEGEPSTQALTRTLDEAGPGILVTSACLALGFASLLPSSFVNARMLGGLTSATVIAALASDLLLLPACCRLIWGEDDP
ncbi:MAG: MMPL family transporter [Alphaproteobacteria bacterium]|nr:MMPL family transporter [Alphaproteobacteria bacterium]MCB9792000.1 MMPL family transporter [Alphaproteobacteria bacterium]